MATQGGRDVRTERIRQEYARWLMQDRLTLAANGLPTSHVGFADAKGVSDRTLRRWRTDDDEFAELLLAEERRLAASVPGGTLRRAGSLEHVPDDVEAAERAAAEGLDDPDYLDYLRVKTAIRDKAMDSDRASLELYMKHWGHEHAAQEREQRERGFAHLSDDELVTEVRRMLMGLEVGASGG